MGEGGRATVEEREREIRHKVLLVNMAKCL